jgi:hypothetical protein
MSSHTKRGAGSLESMRASEPSPVVEEVLRFEELPLGSRGTRRAVVRWSDGSEGEALTWYADLCGRPHKSSYAASRVMPTTSGDPGSIVPHGLQARHNADR